MSINLGDVFGLVSTLKATTPTKVKMFEDDPTLFGEILRRHVSFPHEWWGRRSSHSAEVMAVTEMRDKLKSDIAKFAPRCQNCVHLVATVDNSEDYSMNATVFTASATCAKNEGYSTTCPDGQTAVRRGCKATVVDHAVATDDLLDVIKEALKILSVAQPNITPASPDTPTTLSDEVW